MTLQLVLRINYEKHLRPFEQLDKELIWCQVNYFCNCDTVDGHHQHYESCPIEIDVVKGYRLTLDDFDPSESKETAALFERKQWLGCAVQCIGYDHQMNEIPWIYGRTDKNKELNFPEPPSSVEIRKVIHSRPMFLDLVVAEQNIQAGLFMSSCAVDTQKLRSVAQELNRQGIPFELIIQHQQQIKHV